MNFVHSALIVLASVVLGCTDGVCHQSIRTPTRQGWRAEAEMYAAVNRAAAAELNGLMYVAGGNNSSYITAAFQSYDPSTNTWANLPPMPEVRYDGNGMASINGKLYVPGGWNGTLPTNTLYVYDPAFGWTTKAHIPHLSGCGVTGAINSKLYVLTPCNGFSGIFKLFDVYDPSTNAWTSLAQPMGAYTNVQGAAVNGKFYVAGGCDVHGAITGFTEVYDPDTNTWAQLASMPTPLDGGASAELDGKLWVFGGDDCHGNLYDLVQIYDPVSGIWQTGKYSLPAKTTEAMAATVDGVAFVAGGGTSIGITGATEGLFVLPSIP